MAAAQGSEMAGGSPPADHTCEAEDQDMQTLGCQQVRQGRAPCLVQRQREGL